VLVLRIVESLGWVFGCSLGGERWDGKEKEGETEEESVGRWVGIYWFFPMESPTDSFRR
jgi:hypothetical protein